MDPVERLLDVNDLADLLNVSPAYIRKLAKVGRLPAFRLDDGNERSTWRFRESDVRQWIEARRTVPA